MSAVSEGIWFPIAEYHNVHDSDPRMVRRLKQITQFPANR
jgi:hypothetical protein